MKKISILAFAFVFLGFLIGINAEASAASSSLRPLVIEPEKFDVSPALREIRPIPPAPFAKTRQIPMKRLPKAKMSQLAPVIEGDGALQLWHGYMNMPATTQNFEGINNTYGVYPPDPNGDVGPNHYVQTVNLGFQIWDKTGTSLYGPANTNTLWTGFGGACETSNDGDPIVLYDHLADRWFISQFALPNFPNSPFYQCIAVSQTADPTGSWYRYSYSFSVMNDYPKFGVWPDGYYMSINQFASGTTAWAGAGVAVFDRSSMLTGAAATMQYFNLYSVNSCYGGLLPSDLDGTSPPAGAPNYFSSVDDGSWSCGSASDNLKIWEFHVDWATPANSTFGLSGQPNLILNTTAFDVLCSGTRSCIPQPGTAVGLDAIGDRLMYRLQYRNFGTYEAMVVNHTVDAGSGRAGIRWYELRDIGAGWAINQQGTYAPADTEHRWMGSIAMDVQGNLALGYSVSSSTVYPSIRYAGRLTGDPAGTLPQTEATIIAGTGSQTGTGSRWGDYSSMSVDPTDGCTFWYTQEYIQTTGTANWRTRIASFKFPGCTAGPTGTLQGTVTDASTTNPINGATVTATGGFSTTTNGAGFYQFASMPVGTYDVTASAYGYQSSTVTGVAITDGGTTTQDFALTPRAAATVQGTVTDGSGHGWPLYAEIEITATGYSNTVYTNPSTGQYSINLYVGENYSFDVSATGYNSETRSVTPSAGTNTENFALTVDSTCTAPGYQIFGVNEQFESGTTPTDWTVVDTAGTGAVWTFNDPGARGNLTGGTGGFAIADSDNAGTINMDTSLITPTVNFTGIATVNLEFDTDFNSYSTEIADVDVSNNGGSTWTNVWRKTGADYRGPKHETVDISAIAGNQSNVKIRFHYYNANYDWWWQVDNVLAGACQAVSSGLVTGYVYDANTSSPISGATVADDLSNSTTTDSSGYYSLASTPGSRTLTASMSGGYGNDIKIVNVVANNTVQQNFNLPAPQLSANPTGIKLAIDVNSGLTANRTLTLSNTGTASATFDIKEVQTGRVVFGPFQKPDFVVKPFRQNSRTSQGLGLPEPPIAPPYAAGNVIQSWAGPTGAWGIAYDGTDDTVWTSSPSAGWGGNNTIYEYTTAGALTGRSWPYSWNPANGPADAAFNWNTGMLWVMNINSGVANCIYEIDPASGYTGTSICPGGGTGFATSQRGLAYDPTTDTFFAGSWNDSMIHHFDSSGTMLDEVNVGLAIAGLAYNPTTQHLFVMVNNAPNPVYVLDAANNYTLLGQFNVSSGFGDYAGSGLEIDCNGNLWAVDQNSDTVYQIESGETTDVCIADIPWLTETPTTGAIAASANQAISVDFNATGLSFGNYWAKLKIQDNTPYTDQTVPVKMAVIKGVVTLFSPNGGEKIATGSNYLIEWGARAEAHHFTLKYSLNKGLTWKTIAKNITEPEYLWTVPVTWNNKKKCLMKVIAFNSAGVKLGADKSNAKFTIEVVRLTSPNGGENWTSGTGQNITWTTNSVKGGTVTSTSLSYSTDNGLTWKPITTQPGNPGTYNWLPYVASVKTKCKVKIVLKNAAGKSLGNDISDAVFTISP